MYFTVSKILISLQVFSCNIHHLSEMALYLEHPLLVKGTEMLC
jgi:hypothetical protein